VGIIYSSRDMNNFKTANAKQAKDTHHYKHINEKLCTTKASIRFNKMCSTYQTTVRSESRCALKHKQICRNCLRIKLNGLRPV